MDLLHKLKDELANMGVAPDAKVLVAVSGGIDSMVLLHLLHQTQLEVMVAHCNFKLRGSESDADEQLVRNTAEQLSIRCFSKSFNTDNFSRDNGISIQMAARELRYAWFKELAVKENCSHIATAHHANDVAETVLLNLMRGAGLAGVHGIRATNDRVIRPLIRCHRQELVDYAQKHQITWREDASNQDTHYERNFIRHEVMPLLQSINPKVEDALNKHASIVGRYENILSYIFQQAEATCCNLHHHGTFKTIDIVSLQNFPEPATILYHLLKEQGFAFEACEVLLKNDTQSGVHFIQNHWKIIKDRQQLVVVNMEHLDAEETYNLTTGSNAIETRFGTFEINVVEQPDQDFGKPHVAYLAADALNFPLEIRSIKSGDRFHPLGMHHSKLVSDFFTDMKTSYVDRATAYAVCSGQEIVWLAPFRIDDRFKINDQTTRMLRIEWSVRP